MTEIPYWNDAFESALGAELIGRKVVAASIKDAALTLDNGVVLEFERHNSDCCSSVDLRSLAATDSIITAVKVEDDEDKEGGEGAYRAWIHVITEAGEVNIAEADGDASNGYYLHGFALDVTVHQPVTE